MPSADAGASGRPIGGRAALALTVAFMSGLTSLGYQVLWIRLLASGTGNTTYVFTVILGVFLIGLAIGALVFNLVRSRIGDPVRFLAVAQIVVAVLVMVGLVGVLVRPENLDPGKPLATLQALLASTILVVLPVTVVLGMSFPGGIGAARRRRPPRRQRVGLPARGQHGRARSPRSVLIPFLLIPILGSPLVVVLLALLNAAVGIALAVARAADGPDHRRRRRGRRRWRWPAVPLLPDVLVQPNVRDHRGQGRQGLRVDRGRDRLGPGRPDHVHARALGRGHVDDAADRRRQADAGPAGHRAPGLDARPGRRVRDGIGVPRRRSSPA